MEPVIYFKKRDGADSPYRQHELREPSRPKLYADFFEEHCKLMWAPASPHSLHPRDLWTNLLATRRAHSAAVEVAPSISALIARRLGVLSENYFVLFWGNASKSWLRRLSVRLGLGCAREVWVNDHGTGAELVSEWGVSASQVVWLPFPVDANYYHPVNRPSADYVLVPGDTKRDEVVVLATAAVLDVPVRRSMKGCSTESIYRQLPVHLMERIQVKTWEPFSVIRSNYQHALAVFLPLDICPEPVGLTAVLEAMACGRPLIISEGRAAADHIIDGETGFILRGDRAHWPEQIKMILADRANLDRVGRAARDYVMRHHSFEVVTPYWARLWQTGGETVV